MIAKVKTMVTKKCIGQQLINLDLEVVINMV